MAIKFSTNELLDFLCEYIRQNSKPTGMMGAAAEYFCVDPKTIKAALDELRRRKRLGRDVFRRWRDG